MPGQAIVSIRDKQWTCSVANTFTELTTGLSGVESIPPQTGVLFDLGVDENSIQINMLQMLFPLDIIFINSAQGGVVGVMSNVQPGWTDVRFEATTIPGARFFLEVNAGEALGIEDGDLVNIQGYPQASAPQISFTTMLLIGLVAGMMANIFQTITHEVGRR